MVKKQFSGLEIEFWVHEGKLGKTQHSLCLFHDSLEIGSPILEALYELRTETRPASCKLTFAASSRKQGLLSLRLMVVPKREDLQVMCICYDVEGAKIEMTDEGLKLLIEAFTAWLSGGEDFGVSPRHSKLNPNVLGKLDRESIELWFWGPRYVSP